MLVIIYQKEKANDVLNILNVVIILFFVKLVLKEILTVKGGVLFILDYEFCYLNGIIDFFLSERYLKGSYKVK